MREIQVRSGSWSVTKDLVLPKGYTVLAGPGTRLDLKKGASIISYSKLKFSGTEGHPVVLTSSDKSGGGLAVIGAEKESFVRYVKFDGLSNPAEKGWALTGAVTFYESPVRFEKTEFVRARCEDALNIVRTDFTIDGSLFSKAKGDAFDSDFSVGTITNSAFAESGNDAVDVSGSKVTLNKVRIEGTGDKGISAGEISEVDAKGVAIINAVIGVASKDISVVTLENVRIESARIALTAYTKKPEFGGGYLKTKDVAIIDSEYPFIIGSSSMLDLNDVRHRASAAAQLKILEAFK
jgi:hypothetical protein